VPGDTRKERTDRRADQQYRDHCSQEQAAPQQNVSNQVDMRIHGNLAAHTL
jgi:hypothetical protein